MNELIAAFTISPPTPCSHDFSKGRRRGEIVILISPPLLCAPFKHNLMISLFSIILYSSNTVGRSIDRTYYHYFMVKLCLSPTPTHSIPILHFLLHLPAAVAARYVAVWSQGSSHGAPDLFFRQSHWCGDGGNSEGCATVEL